MMGGTNRTIGIAAIVIVLIVIVAAAIVLSINSSKSNGGSSTLLQNSSVSNAGSVGQIRVVAAENFWGSLMGMLCGTRCNVTSIISNPNADPHAYEASPVVAEEISGANIVIVNGLGYDTWALRLLGANSNPNRTVLNAGQIVGLANGSNPHIWYNPAYVNATIKQMYLSLVKADPSNTTYYGQQYAALNSSLAQVDGRIAKIGQQFGGTKVAATEDIFVYLANASGLDLVSPPEFMEAVAEGIDPSVQSVTEFQNQLESGNVSVLVYNQQTVTPLTQQMKQIAIQHNVTVVGITETIQPPDVSFPVWMNSELLNLQNALNANALGQ